MSDVTAAQLTKERAGLELAVATELGRLVMAFGEFVAGLYLCVAWFEAGLELERRVGEAEDKSVKWLISRIAERSQEIFPVGSAPRALYSEWVSAADVLRVERNCFVHSRWGLEPADGVAVAVSSPILAEPIERRRVTPSDLRGLTEQALSLRSRLSKLRDVHPL